MNATTATALLPPLGQPTSREPDYLVPDRLRRIGRLDDSIGIQTTCPRPLDEIARHRDYRNWESERAAEAALVEHQRRVRASSYVPLATNLFRVH